MLNKNFSYLCHLWPKIVVEFLNCTITAHLITSFEGREVWMFWILWTLPLPSYSFSCSVTLANSKWIHKARDRKCSETKVTRIAFQKDAYQLMQWPPRRGTPPTPHRPADNPLPQTRPPPPSATRLPQEKTPPGSNMVPDRKWQNNRRFWKL